VIRGMLDLASQFDIPIVGGDTNLADGPLTICVTAIGLPRDKPCWLRSNAKIGDQIVVTGELGGSIVGHHLSFTPRVSESEYLQKNFSIHSAMDISDGLLLDLDRMCNASRVGAALDLAAIPVSANARQLALTTGKSPLQHALQDGEDFELLLTVSAHEWSRLKLCGDLPVRLTRIGYITQQLGLWQTENGVITTSLAPQGYIHR
jgi:thiamine-monophosphate kinase